MPEKKENRYEQLIAFAPDPIVILSTAGVIRSLNGAAEKASGYTAAEIVGRQFAAVGIIAPSFLPKVAGEFLLTLTGQERPTFEVEIILKNGTRTPFEIHAHLIRYSGEAGSDMLVIFRDVSERKKAQAAILESEARYRTLAESARDAIYVIDGNDRNLYINGFGADLFRKRPADIVGKKIQEIFPVTSFEEVKRKLEIVRSTKMPHLEDEKLSFPGGDLWFEASLIPIFDEKGEIREIMGISRDITDRRNKAAQMHLQAEALEAASNGILISDKHGAIVWVNGAFSRMTGYALDEIKGKTPRILKSGEQRAHVYNEMWATILLGKTWTGELINRRKDGTLYFEYQTITPVKNSQNEIIHFIAIKQDISANKLLEAQFKQAQKMEAVGRLAGGVAHDFNNLLTVILGQCDLVLGELPTGSGLIGNIEEIRESGRRASNLTRQLLAFSRKQIFQIKVMDLNEIVRGADKLLRRLLGEDIESVTLFGQNMRPIKVDPAQIEQVIMNLVVNARDAMPNGGKLVIETSGVVMDDERSRAYLGMIPGDYLLLKVKDTGCGMTPEVQTKIFEPFFTTKGQGKGTGLGLATVYGIVKQSKGFIYVESEENKGTSFLIFIPVSSESKDSQDGSSTPELPRGTGTILVAEDEELVRGLAVQVLARQGYRVLEARTGTEALKIAESNKGEPIGLLFTDMIMPQMGGNELAEKITAKYPGMKIIFTSGYSDHSVVQKWIDRGCRFLQKPYTHAELLSVIQSVLGKKSHPENSDGGK